MVKKHYDMFAQCQPLDLFHAPLTTISGSIWLPGLVGKSAKRFAANVGEGAMSSDFGLGLTREIDPCPWCPRQR